jgi:hypothetical protein
MTRPFWRRRGVLAAAGCAVIALATLAAFQLSGNGAAGEVAGSVGGSTPRPSSGGTVSLPAGAVGGQLSISKASVWDDDPSSASIGAAASAFDSGSSSGWQTTTQFKNGSFSGSYSGGSGIGLIFDLGSAHTVDQLKFEVGSAGATVEVLTGTGTASSSPSWSPTAGPAGYKVQATRQNVSAGGDITVQFDPVATQYVMIVFTTMPYLDADGANGTPAGYRDSLIDVRAYGA